MDLLENDRADYGVAYEPAFDLPPLVGGSIERRLAERATRLWLKGRGDAPMPAARGYRAALEALALDDFTDHSIVLGISEAGTRVAVVSPAVSAAFGVRPGPLIAGIDDLAARLTAAVAVLAVRSEAVPFEGAFIPDGGRAATLLTRGVALPLADDDGSVVAAHVVVTWTETLSPEADDSLRDELRHVFGLSSDAVRRTDAFRFWSRPTPGC